MSETADMASLSRAIDELVLLLQNETKAVMEGRALLPPEGTERKYELLQLLETHDLALSQAIAHKDGARLRKKATKLGSALNENSVALEAIARVAGRLARDIKLAKERATLKGLYGKKGETVLTEKDAPDRINKSL